MINHCTHPVTTTKKSIMFHILRRYEPLCSKKPKANILRVASTQKIARKTSSVASWNYNTKQFCFSKIEKTLVIENQRSIVLKGKTYYVQYSRVIYQSLSKYSLVSPGQMFLQSQHHAVGYDG